MVSKFLNAIQPFDAEKIVGFSGRVEVGITFFFFLLKGNPIYSSGWVVHEER